MKNRIWLGIFCLLFGCSKENTWQGVPPRAGESTGAPVSDKETLKLQQAEVSRLKLEQKEAFKQAKQSHDTKRKEWEKAEKTARHSYFEKHPKGAERRAYIQDFLKRREGFFKGLSEELKDLERQDEKALSELKEAHAAPKNSQNALQDLQSKPD